MWCSALFVTTRWKIDLTSNEPNSKPIFKTHFVNSPNAIKRFPNQSKKPNICNAHTTNYYSLTHSARLNFQVINIVRSAVKSVVCIKQRFVYSCRCSTRRKKTSAERGQFLIAILLSKQPEKKNYILELECQSVCLGLGFAGLLTSMQHTHTHFHCNWKLYTIYKLFAIRATCDAQQSAK